MNEPTNVSQRNVMLLEDTSIAHLIESFLKAHDVKEISREGYRRRLRQFFGWCTRNLIRQPTREVIIQYKRELMERKHTAYTISGYLVAVRNFFKWAHTMKLCEDVTKGIKGTRRQKGFCRDAFSVDQVNLLLSSIDRFSALGKRDFALLNLLARCGLRTQEVCTLSISDIRQVNGETVLMVQSKNSDSKSDMVVLVENTLKPVIEYLSTRGNLRPSDALFASEGDGNKGHSLSTRTIRYVVKQRLRAIGIDNPRLTSHSFRHFIVSTALENGVSLIETQQAARHSSLLSTMLYSHVGTRSKGIAEKKIDEVLQGAANTSHQKVADTQK